MTSGLFASPLPSQTSSLSSLRVLSVPFVLFGKTVLPRMDFYGKSDGKSWLM